MEAVSIFENWAILPVLLKMLLWPVHAECLVNCRRAVMEAPDWHVGLQQQHAYQHSDMMDIGTCRNILVQLLKPYSFWGIRYKVLSLKFGFRWCPSPNFWAREEHLLNKGTIAFNFQPLDCFEQAFSVKLCVRCGIAVILFALLMCTSTISLCALLLLPLSAQLEVNKNKASRWAK